MGFSRQEYWSGLPFPSPGNLPDPGTEPKSPAFRTVALPSEPPGKPTITIDSRYYYPYFIYTAESVIFLLLTLSTAKMGYESVFS